MSALQFLNNWLTSSNLSILAGPLRSGSRQGADAFLQLPVWGADHVSVLAQPP